MAAVRIQITRWIDNYFPGIVRCELLDAWNCRWTFVEKAPIVSVAELWRDASYPQPGLAECTVVRRWHDDDGREIVTIDTDNPGGFVSESGQTTFDVLPMQLHIE